MTVWVSFPAVVEAALKDLCGSHQVLRLYQLKPNEAYCFCSKQVIRRERRKKTPSLWKYIFPDVFDISANLEMHYTIIPSSPFTLPEYGVVIMALGSLFAQVDASSTIVLRLDVSRYHIK